MATRSRVQESSFMRYESYFDLAVEHISDSNSKLKLSDTQKLALYGLYKQATCEDNNTPKPGILNPVNGAKWKSWYQLRGLSATMAKRRYVMKVLEMDTQFVLPNGNRAIQTTDVNSSKSIRNVRSSSSNSVSTMERKVRLWKQLGFVVLHMLLFAVCYGVLLRGARALYRNYVLVYWPSMELEYSMEPFFGVLAGFLMVKVFNEDIPDWKALMMQCNSSAQQKRKKIRRASTRTNVGESNLMASGIFIEKGRGNGARPVLTYEVDQAATQFNVCEKIYEFPFTKVVDMYFNKFKEPFPDPRLPELEQVSVEFERTFAKWHCDITKRVFKIRNTAPALIKRLLKQSHVFFVEECLLDRRNNIFYVRGCSQSFSKYGVLRSFSKFEVCEENPEWTKLTQLGEAQLSSSLGFARGMIENFLRRGYERAAEDARNHLEERLIETSGN